LQPLQGSTALFSSRSLQFTSGVFLQFTSGGDTIPSESSCIMLVRDQHKARQLHGMQLNWMLYGLFGSV
ncbi:hypothetical protein, partial [Sediminispirochaeta bajacaliforniensis]|uniref:hypothetical protein n=1 Tax=Sediminispirochaeta bajacaliforniensis TaxID=148 RepID=UPI0005261112